MPAAAPPLIPAVADLLPAGEKGLRGSLRGGGAGFQTLVHADWSAHERGRWAARATRTEHGWRAEAPFRVPPLEQFVDELLSVAVSGPTLAGFDFPIGLPARYGERTGFDGFRDALDRFGTGAWEQVYVVAATPGEVALHRPFYPARSGGTRRQHLLDGHAVAHIDALTRRCERGGGGLRAAGCMFWTLGASQVGKAAIVGWRDLVGPARRKGAALWPFEGDLATLAARGGLTLAETYPADVYAVVGAGFEPRESKRSQDHRARKAQGLLRWTESAQVRLTAELHDAIRAGFGPDDKGGDRFDAVVGLFGMIAVSDGTRPEGAPPDDAIRRWEGWILGRPSVSVT